MKHFDLASLKHKNERYKAFCELVQSMPEGEFKFTFSAKDNLCTKDFQSRAGSKILEGYRPPFDAEPVRRLRAAGGLLIGKTNMDEFGFGTFSTNSAFGVPLNPFDPERACGGSSGGAAAAAAMIDGHVALGVSTGGSISCPASFCGVVGLTPTYGRVSRYGLIDYGNSLDKVGLLSRHVSGIEQMLPIISGSDPKDPTSCCQNPLDMTKGRSGPIAVPRECLEGVDPKVLSAFNAAMERMTSEQGREIVQVDMPSLKFAMPAYYVLATTEASTNLARYSGMLFGVPEKEYNQHFNDYFSGVRTDSFGEEAKRRILLGTFCRMVGFRDKYYLKALGVRHSIIQEYEAVLKQYAFVASPTMPIVAPRFDEIRSMKPVEVYLTDFLTLPPNLTGLPHISVPCGYAAHMPVGMQLVAPHWEEGALVQLAKQWEKGFTFKISEVSA